jgi:hypothetical protein
MNVEPRVTVRTHNWRKLPFTIIQGFEGGTVKAYSAVGALRLTRLIPGSKVKVWLPVIVHERRARRLRKTGGNRYIARTWKPESKAAA